MFEPTNPDIDTARLAERARIERNRPPVSNARRADAALTQPAALASDPPRPDAWLRWKRRLRAVPLLGPALARANAWRRRHDLRGRAHRIPGLGAMLRWTKSLALLTRTRHRAHLAEERTRALEAEVSTLRAQLDDALHERAAWSDLRPLLDAMKAEHRNRAEELAAQQRAFDDRLGKLSERADLLHGDVLFQQRRLESLTAGTTAATPGTETAPPAPFGQGGREAHVSDRLANVYEAFEDRFRGERGDIKQRQAIYLDPIRAAGAGTPDRPVLDIGCGRGEWLELLGEHGLHARGVDVNAMAVAVCREHGVDARAADMFTALAEAGDGGLGAVTIFHVIEHLAMETLVDLLDAARTALAPGGALILETPNPENLIVGAHTFHNDPTHKAPIPPAVGQFLVTQRGFADATIWRLHPMSDTDQLRGADPGTQQANRLLYGPQDYAVLARRP